MTFHRTLLHLSRRPMAGSRGRSGRVVLGSKTVSSSFVLTAAPTGTGALSAFRCVSTATDSLWPSVDAALSPARAKLQHVLEEYRQNNFSQTLFSRFIKEMIQATDADHDGRISRSELSKLLDNIGAKDQLNAQEVQEIMDELGQMEEGEVEKQIHIDTLEDMILNPNDSNSTVMA